MNYIIFIVPNPTPHPQQISKIAISQKWKSQTNEYSAVQLFSDLHTCITYGEAAHMGEARMVIQINCISEKKESMHTSRLGICKRSITWRINAIGHEAAPQIPEYMEDRSNVCSFGWFSRSMKCVGVP